MAEVLNKEKRNAEKRKQLYYLAKEIQNFAADYVITENTIMNLEITAKQIEEVIKELEAEWKPNE